MKTTTKRLLAAGCCLGAAATWIPIFLAGAPRAPNPPSDIPAEPTQSAIAPSASPRPVAEPRAEGAVTASPVPPPQAESPLGGSAGDIGSAIANGADSAAAPIGLSRTLADLEERVGRTRQRSEALLAQLSQAWSQNREQRAAAVLPIPDDSASRTPPVAVAPPAAEAPADPAEEFLRTHPLRGCLSSSTAQSALLGDLIVRPGDVLAGGSLQVTAIGAGHVVVTQGSGTTRIVLEPFRSQPPRRQGSDAPVPASQLAAPTPALPAAPLTVPNDSAAAAGSGSAPQTSPSAQGKPAQPAGNDS